MKQLEGIIPYLVTPTRDDDDVDLEALRTLIQKVSQSSIHGLSPLGSSGELQFLSEKQRESVIRTTVESTTLPTIPGVGHHSSRAALDQAQMCQDLGASAVVLMHFNQSPGNVSQSVDYFTSICDSISIPVVLYSNPGRGTGVSWEAIDEMASHPRVEYLKDASGQTADLVDFMSKSGNNLTVFAASAHPPVTLLAFGAAGWMAGPACFLPEECLFLYDLYKREGYSEKVRELEKKFISFNSMFANNGLGRFLKALLNEAMLPVGQPLQPQRAVSSTIATIGLQVATEIRRSVDLLGGRLTPLNID